MSKAAYITTDIWLKELVLNKNPDLDKFYKEELIKMINFCREEITRYKEVIDKALDYLENTTIVADSYYHQRECLLNILKEVKINDN